VKKIVVIKGDGVGPELTEAAMLVLEAVKPDIEIELCDAGYEWWVSAGRPKMPTLIPEETWNNIFNSDACLKAPTTTPPDPEAPGSVAINIRRRMDLYANLRPIKTFKGREGPFGSIDFLCVREATEGLYIGAETMIDYETGIAIRKISKKGSSRIAKIAFEQAKTRGYSKVIVITKRNVLRLTDSIFWNSVNEVAKDYSEIGVEEYFIDNMAQQLIKNPQRFNQNVLLSTNLFMDIISELASALVGNIGLICSANIGEKYAMFEPAHGSAPKYKGQYKVNPTAMILSAAWMLEYLGFKKHSQSIFKAVEQIIQEGKTVTYDLGGNASTLAMAKAIAELSAKYLDEL